MGLSFTKTNSRSFYSIALFFTKELQRNYKGTATLKNKKKLHRLSNQQCKSTLFISSIKRRQAVLLIKHYPPHYHHIFRLSFLPRFLSLLASVLLVTRSWCSHHSLTPHRHLLNNYYETDANLLSEPPSKALFHTQ